MTRADQILEAFVVFHTKHPRVWVLFKKFALEAIAAGRLRYSSDCVCHRIRWHEAVEVQGEDVKINDHHTAYYARLFHIAFPEHQGFFRNRHLLSEDKQAAADDKQVFHSGEPGPEETITERLQELLKTPYQE